MLGSSKLLFAEATLSRRRVNDKLAPRRGYVFDVGVRLASDALVSDTDIAQWWSNLTWLIPQGDKARIKLRGEVGAMAVGNFEKRPLVVVVVAFPLPFLLLLPQAARLRMTAAAATSAVNLRTATPRL